MGKYVKLESGKDWLEGTTGIVAARAATAEAQADLLINTELEMYDRSTWAFDGGAIPPEIATIAKKRASGEYRRISFNAASPDADTPKYANDLISEAENGLAVIKARGFIWGKDGSRIYPVQTGAGSIFATINSGGGP